MLLCDLAVQLVSLAGLYVILYCVVQINKSVDASTHYAIVTDRRTDGRTEVHTPTTTRTALYTVFHKKDNPVFNVDRFSTTKISLSN